LVASIGQPEGKTASALGDAQKLPDGGVFVGWGALPYISEFSPTGQLVYNAELAGGAVSYRAYLEAWHPPI
jgi:hypothetical protein